MVQAITPYHVDGQYSVVPVEIKDITYIGTDGTMWYTTPETRSIRKIKPIQKYFVCRRIMKSVWK